MTKEEAKAEINKVFEPAFANYIITALTEGATPSERKTGKWIKAQYPFEQCSICGEYFDTVNNQANYCCVCGAKMEGVIDDDKETN